MSTRARYQFGCLTRRKRFRGGDVWQFRFSETTMEDRRCRRSRLIGTLAQYPTRADILRVVERFRLRINLKHRFAMPVMLDAVVDHYVERELPILRFGTQQSHLCTLNRWILPRWGRYLLEQVKPVDVEEWLRSLPLAPKSKANIRNLFHLIYVHARRWELTDSNPIDLVRQSAGRKTIPRTLSTREIGLLLPQLAEPYRTMVLVAACLGLRVSEIIGLQWGDFNWEDLTLLVKRSVVHGRVGDTKTEASQLRDRRPGLGRSARRGRRASAGGAARRPGADEHVAVHRLHRQVSSVSAPLDHLARSADRTAIDEAL